MLATTDALRIVVVETLLDASSVCAIVPNVSCREGEVARLSGGASTPLCHQETAPSWARMEASWLAQGFGGLFADHGQRGREGEDVCGKSQARFIEMFLHLSISSFLWSCLPVCISRDHTLLPSEQCMICEDPQLWKARMKARMKGYLYAYCRDGHSSQGGLPEDSNFP